MKGWGIIIVLGIAVLLVFGIVFSGLLPHSDDAAITGLAPGQTAVFQGHTLQFPEPWRQYTRGSRGGTLMLKKAGSGRTGGTLVLEDERRKPEDASRFVSGWMASMNNPGFKPQSTDEYHDAAVDGAGMHCVALHWADANRPLQLVCLASDGRWKLTLSGNDGDIPGLDALAGQMPAFTRGV